jgi:hypothetical protein
MQQRNRLDDVETATHVDGQNGLPAVSFDESLNHSMNHYHIAARQRQAFTPVRCPPSADTETYTCGVTPRE